MNKKFSELRNKMSDESKERANKLFQILKFEIETESKDLVSKDKEIIIPKIH